jgi:hypothetical protein
MRSKAEMMVELRRMLHDMLAAREVGDSHPRLARAQGCVDGYMRALLESGQATKEELLELVALERCSVSGPATRELAVETAAQIATA